MRASVLGVVDWLLVFVTVPLALAVAVFPLVWAPGVMLQEHGATLPWLSRWVLGGVFNVVWSAVALTALAGGCGRVRLGVRRGLLVGALLWSCFGVGLTWLAVSVPIFVGASGY